MQPFDPQRAVFTLAAAVVLSSVFVGTLVGMACAWRFWSDGQACPENGMRNYLVELLTTVMVTFLLKPQDRDPKP